MKAQNHTMLMIQFCCMWNMGQLLVYFGKKNVFRVSGESINDVFQKVYPTVHYC